MKVLTKQYFIKEQKYMEQLIAHILFLVAALFFASNVIGTSNDTQFNRIVSYIFSFFVILLPFGYFLGVSKIVKVLKKVNSVKNNKMYILEKKVIDKTEVTVDDSGKYRQLIFSEDDGIWVNYKQDKQVKVGDICYLFYFSGSLEPCAVYSTKIIELDEDFRKMLVR